MIEGYFPSDASEYLRIELELRQRRNSSYSIRAFARDLQLSPSHLSEFLSGKSLLSVRKADDLATQLCLSLEQREHWQDLIALKANGDIPRKKAKLRVQKRMKSSKSQVSLEVFKAIADWQHFALLAFFGMDPSLTAEDLSLRMGLPELEIEEAIQRLVRLDLLEKFPEGHRPPANSSFTGDSIPSEAVRESHRQVLRKSIDALELFGMDERMSQSFFFSVPEKNMPKLREALRKKVIETISEFSEDQPQPQDSVQALTWQMFPVEQKGKNT